MESKNHNCSWGKNRMGDARRCPCKTHWSSMGSFRSSSRYSGECVDQREAELWLVCRQVRSWTPAECCIWGRAWWRGWGCAGTLVPSGSPGSSGQRWEGSGAQARWWAVGWCGWHTCRKGFQKTAPSWTLALKTPRQPLLRRGSPWEPSWHKRGTHSRTWKGPRHQRSSVDTRSMPEHTLGGLHADMEVMKGRCEGPHESRKDPERGLQDGASSPPQVGCLILTFSVWFQSSFELKPAEGLDKYFWQAFYLLHLERWTSCLSACW